MCGGVSACVIFLCIMYSQTGLSVFVINRTLLGLLYRHNCPLIPAETFKFKASYANGNIHDCSSQLGASYSKQHVLGTMMECTCICLLHLLCDIQGKRHVMYIMQLHGHIQQQKNPACSAEHVCMYGLYHTH